MTILLAFVGASTNFNAEATLTGVAATGAVGTFGAGINVAVGVGSVAANAAVSSVGYTSSVSTEQTGVSASGNVSSVNTIQGEIVFVQGVSGSTSLSSVSVGLGPNVLIQSPSAMTGSIASVNFITTASFTPTGVSAEGSIGSPEINPNPNAWNISTFNYTAGSAAFDLTTVNPTVELSTTSLQAFVYYYFGAQETLPRHITWKPDGTIFYVLGDTGNDVNQFSVSTPYDPSTASFVTNFSIASQESDPRTLTFSPDGTYMYVSGITGTNSLHQYTLSTPWSVSTASYTQSFAIESVVATPGGWVFKPDGTKMFGLSEPLDRVYSWSLGTAWDISTATYDGGASSLSVATAGTSFYGLYIDSSGTKLFVLNQDEYISRWDLATAWTLNTGSYVSVTPNVQLGALSLSTLTRLVSGTYENNLKSGMWIDPTGSHLTAAGYNTDSIFYWKMGSVLLTDQGAGNVANPQNIFFSSDGTKLYILNGGSTTTSPDRRVLQWDLSTAWDMYTMSYVAGFSVSTQDTLPRGLFFKPDGTKMYVVGSQVGKVHEYSLATAWTVSSASFVQSLTISTEETQPRDLYLSPSGLDLFVLGDSGDDVNQYALSTAWDISTASYVQAFSISSQETSPQALSFKPDGTRMYVMGTSGDDINEYHLSSSWDVSTASYVRKTNNLDFVVGTTPTGIFFKPNGESLWVVDEAADRIAEFIVPE